MTGNFWVIINRHGVDRLTKTDRYELSRYEKAVQCTISWPDNLFEPAPTLTAKFEIRNEHVGGDAVVVVDPQESLSESRDDYGQRMLNRLAAQLIERAVNSDFEDDRKFGLEALAMCRGAGLDVRIEVPEEKVAP